MQNQLPLRRYGIFVCYFSVLCLYVCTGWAQKIKSLEDVLGYRAGADYKLARYETIVEYFRHVDENSDRVNIRELGATTEGKQLIIAEISSPETIGDIRRHMGNSRKIADPRFIGNNEEERHLIEESKVVVFIRCNVHSTEIASSQMAMELLYDLAAGTSPEIKEILARTIVVLMPSANPDGLDIVVDWYERSLGKPWEGSGMPWLYQKYAGHDNNWDWYMLNLKENRLITRLCYKEWFPNIVWDIHQMGNDGVRLMLPPFIDPQNPDLHPLNTYITLITSGCMASELTRAGKTGLGHGILYNNWSHGGFRLMTNLQNMVGVLSEAASVTIASPIFQRKMESLSVNTPNPWPGGWWRLRDIVEYEKIAGMGLLTFVARNHELYTSYTLTLARDAIEKGKKEPPFAWLVPPDQHDPRTAAEMLEKFNATGVEVHQAESAFTADGVPYPSGTYILYCSQPYRSHLCSLMERQNPSIIPNRVAAWTLPLQMGVRSVAVNQPFEAKARKLPSIPMPEGGTRGPGDADGYLVRAASNDDYRLINRLSKAGISFYVISSGDKWKKETGVDTPTGSFFISDGKKVRSALPGLLKGISTTLIGVRGSSAEQRSILLNAAAPRIGLYQPWTASMDEGWTRFILDEFEYAYTSVHNAEILKGNLRQRYDCLILPSDGTRLILNGQAPDTTEPQYVGGIGPDGIACLEDFVRGGGTLVCIDETCNLPIEHLNIPVRNIVQGKKQGEFFCPGSILRIRVEREHPVGYGMEESVSGYFIVSQAFDSIKPEEKKEDPRSPAQRFPVTVVARYSDTALLESGIITGGGIIADKPAIVEVQYGKGHIVLFGFRVQHRAQTPGTFRFLFNAIQRSTFNQ